MLNPFGDPRADTVASIIDLKVDKRQIETT